MRIKLFGISVLCILIGLGLSGCWHQVVEIYHFQDGSGRWIKRDEVTQDLLVVIPDYSSMEEARDDWVNKRKEKMILERLKERKERLHTKEVLLKEQSVIDEIASIYVGMDEL